MARSSRLDLIDETNRPNPWQGSMRFGKHGSAADLISRAVNDTRKYCPYDVKTALFVTHLNETNDMICTKGGNVSIEELECTALQSGIKKLYLSRDRYSSDVTEHDLTHH